MAFLDEIGKKISQTSQGMVQKTKDTAETMRLNGAISDEEKRIQNLYLEIGKAYFELHADDCEEALKELVLGIKEAQTKIEDYQEQVKRLKGIVRCAVCGGEVPYGAPFCSSCGSKMMNENTVEPTAESNVRRCANCGLPLADGIAFCTNCGTKAEVAPAPVAAPAVRTCANCGNVLADGMAFCMNCGTPVAAAPAPVAAPAVRTCANCGNVLGDGMAFCMNCGTKA